MAVSCSSVVIIRTEEAGSDTVEMTKGSPSRGCHHPSQGADSPDVRPLPSGLPTKDFARFPVKPASLAASSPGHLHAKRDILIELCVAWVLLRWARHSKS